MKKILVLSGSPRKGDSYRVVKHVEEKMKQLGDVEFEYIMLRKLNIGYCLGCSACMKKGEDNCPLKDDVPMIRDKMQQADGVIFASPVYIHTISASIKNLFDRMAYYLHRPCFHDKYALTISTTELTGLKETLHYLAFPVKSMGFNLVGELGILAPAFQEPGPYQDELMADIEKISQDFFRNLSLQPPVKPKLGDVVFFNKLKTKINIHKDKFPADYEYWKKKDWLEAEYFMPVKINPIHKVIGGLPVKLIKFVLRKKLGPEGYHKFMTQSLSKA